MSPGKIISKPVKGVAKSVANFAKQTTFETGKQVSQAAEEIVTQVVGASSAPTQSQPSSGSSSAPGSARGDRDTQEIARLRQEIGGGSEGRDPKAYPKKGQDLEAEMKKIRQQKVEKSQQEEDLLVQMKRQRQEEEMAAKTDTTDALVGTGTKKAKGSAFVVKGTGEKGRKKN